MSEDNKHIYSYLSWMDEEIEALKKMWINPNISGSDMTKVLVKRNYSSIRFKAGGLGLPPHNSYVGDRVDEEYLAKLLTVVDEDESHRKPRQHK